MKKQLVGIFALSLLLGMTACDDKMDPNNPQSVRKELTKRKIPFTPNQFVSYAANDPPSCMGMPVGMLPLM